MTGQSQKCSSHTHGAFKLGLSVFGTALVASLSWNVLNAYSAPDGALPETTSNGAVDSAGSSNDSDRESRLRNIEDELLKKLSLGGEQPATDLPKNPSPVVIREQSPQPRIKEEKRLVSAEAPKAQAARPISDTTDRPQIRLPQSSNVVPPVAKTTPHRTPSRRREPTEHALSAKDLEHRLAISESQLALLTQELETTKGKLVRSETKVQELSKQLEDGGSSAMARPKDYEPKVDAPRDEEISSAPVTDSHVANRSSGDTARITKDRAALRTGPGPMESSITQLPINSIVSVDLRNGSWYRVITSDGTRGWVSGSSLVLREGSYTGSTTRVGAYRPELEPTGINY